MRLTALLLAGAIAPVANAQQIVFNLAGVELTGGRDAAVETRVFQNHTGPPVFVQWEITVDMAPPSWGSELVIEIEHESGYMITLDGSDDNPGDLGPADWTLGFGDEPGAWHSSEAIFAPFPPPDDTMGWWTMRAYDEFDNPGMVDGVLDLHLVIMPPAPGSAVALAAGALGVSHRRRQPVQS